MSHKQLSQFNQLSRMSQRWMYGIAAMVVTLGAVLVTLPARAQAYSQVTSRSILMSSTANGATNVAYQVNFTTVTDGQTVGSVVVEFCSNSPILGDACQGITGFSANPSTLNVFNITGNITGLTVDRTNSVNNRIVLTRTAGAVANGPVSFTLGNGSTNGITNPPTDNTTFFARILTFTNTTGNVPVNQNEANVATDAGGIAISTANQLQVTAKVQEALYFCVYTKADCATGGNDVTLGDENGVLASNSTTYTSTAKYDVSSNAVAGVSIRLKGDTLKSGIFTIDPAVGNCGADPTATNVEMFGLRMLTLGPDQVSTAPYGCATGHHSFDNNSTNGTASQFGQEIARTTGASDITSSTIEFAAKSANTSEAGVYTTTLTLIATATY